MHLKFLSSYRFLNLFFNKNNSFDSYILSKIHTQLHTPHLLTQKVKDSSFFLLVSYTHPTGLKPMTSPSTLVSQTNEMPLEIDSKS